MEGLTTCDAHIGLMRPKDSGCWLSFASRLAAAIALPNPEHDKIMLGWLCKSSCTYRFNAGIR